MDIFPVEKLSDTDNTYPWRAEDLSVLGMVSIDTSVMCRYLVDEYDKAMDS